MVIIQARSKRKPTGGRYKKRAERKRKYEIGRAPALTVVADVKKTSVVRTKGGSKKFKLLRTPLANVFDPKSKSYSKLKINTVVESTANRHFVRRNIITKGCVIETEKGKAKVTSRPGQNNVVNAILI